MQHDLFRSGHDLHMRSNFPNDLLRSNDSLFDASRQEKPDSDKINVVPPLSQKLLQKKIFLAKRIFFSFCSLEAKPLTLDQI